MADSVFTGNTTPPSVDTSPTKCPNCGSGVMKRSNFRTGSVSKPKADVLVCNKCSHRIEPNIK